MTCLSATCEPRTINLSITGERNVASQPRTSDRLACHWRALCLLAYDNWRCSIQPEIFHSLKVTSPSRDLISDHIPYTDFNKYLGFTFASSPKDDNDIFRQMNMLYGRSNTLVR